VEHVIELSISSQAWRYDIARARPAAEIEPVSGSSPKSMRRCNDVFAAAFPADLVVARLIAQIVR